MAYQGKYRTGLVNTAQPKRKWNGWKKPATVEPGSAYKPISCPSVQQRAIFDHVAHNKNNLVVSALAGVGKTSTIVDAMRLFPQGKDLLYVIFANRNAREAESKCEARVLVKTTHALGLAALRKVYGNVQVDADGDKSYAISTALLGPEDNKAAVRHFLCKAMDLCKGYLTDTQSGVIDVIDKHSIETGDMLPAEFADKVLEGMTLAKRQYMRVEYADMVWLPIVLKLSLQQFDLVCLDEAQDASPARLELVLRSVRQGGKLVAIGDQKQSIFGFTSVEENVMQTITDRTSADTLSLTKTFRCGKRIVEHAKAYVPEYEAADSNPEGEVLERTIAEMTAPECDGGAAPGHMIISRTNAPLIPLCLSFIRDSRKATVLGKDLGKNLQYMIRRSGAESVVGFLTWLDEWKNIECEKLIARNKKCDHIVDKYDTLVALTDGLRDLASVKKRIDEMFSEKDEESIITLCTGHKSKGLERSRVWILEETFAKCMTKAKTPFEIEQENNVQYVSATRAIHSLFQVY